MKSNCENKRFLRHDVYIGCPFQSRFVSVARNERNACASKTKTGLKTAEKGSKTWLAELLSEICLIFPGSALGWGKLLESNFAT